jgi:hypothetical protein
MKTDFDTIHSAALETVAGGWSANQKGWILHRAMGGMDPKYTDRLTQSESRQLIQHYYPGAGNLRPSR